MQPLTKVDAQHYEFLIHGTGPAKARGTAEPHFPVRRARVARRRAADRFLTAVREYFVDAPAVLEILRRGDDPAYDTRADRQAK